MEATSITTKLTPPVIGDVCPRPRLYKEIDRARKHSIVWVSGPAGSGKSTLLASYIKEKELPCVWYEMDVRDRDIATLFYFLGQCTERAGDEPRQPMPVWTTDHPEDAHGFARRYFETLFSRLQAPLLLVFDNCHNVPANDRLYELLREGFASIPQGICVVMISRAGPPPVFSRFIASPSMTLIGWEQLQLSPEETAEILPALARGCDRELRLTHQQVKDLHAKSDGWVAGLMLAIKCTPTSHHGPDFHASDAAEKVFNYFATEIFTHFLPSTQAFLMTSAILPNMKGPWIDRLLSTNGSDRILKRLKADNLFIHEYRSSTSIYRYHPLFREFLLARAIETLGHAEVRRLQRNAAKILREEGDAETAFELFEQAEEHTEAEALIVEHAPRLLQQGRAQTLREWLLKLPKAMIAKNPWLAFWAGMSSLGSQPGQGIHSFQDAFETFVTQDDHAGCWHAWYGLIQAHLFEGNDYRKLEPLTEWAIKAKKQGRGFPSTEVESKVMRSLAVAINMFAPERKDLATYVNQALDLPHGPDGEDLVLAATVYGIRGEMQRLTKVLESWKRYKNMNEISAQGQLLSALAEVMHAVFRGEIDRGLEAVKEGLEVAERSGLFALNGLLRTYEAYALLTMGKIGEVELLTEEMAQTVDKNRAFESGKYHFVLSRVALLKEDFVRAHHHAEQAVLDAQKLGSPIEHCIHRIGFAETLHRSGQVNAAKKEIASLEPLARSISHSMTQGLLLIDALVALSEEKERRADERLQEALSLGDKGEFFPIPWPTRTTLASLCRRALTRQMMPDYTRELVRRFALNEATVPEEANVPACIQPGQGSPAVPPEFWKDVRRALRRLYEEDQLSKHPLMKSCLVRQRAGQNPSVTQVRALQDVLTDCVGTLANHASTECWYRALFYTYLKESGSQMRAAENAGILSWGTYRHYLTSGLKEVATRLWLREQACRS